SPAQGRWLSPDPAGLAAVNPADPQTWNAYAYVANQPLEATDPLELLPILDDVDTNPGDPCAYVGDFDASCQEAPGLWPDGEPLYGGIGFGWGGGGGGAVGTPSGAGSGALLPCTAPLCYAIRPSNGESSQGFLFQLPILAGPVLTIVRYVWDTAMSGPAPATPRPPAPATSRNGPPPGAPTVGDLIGRALRQYGACVPEATVAEFGAAGFSDPGSSPTAALGEGICRAQAFCLNGQPLAALDPSYNGPNPGAALLPLGPFGSFGACP
ncbi:MAG: hypothetical protein ACRD2F_07550, partial [Terriglobales bacterium]